MHDAREILQLRVLEAVLGQDLLEGREPAVVGEARAGSIEADRSLTQLDRVHLGRLGEEELRLGIDEATDEPGRGDAVDADLPARDPLHERGCTSSAALMPRARSSARPTPQ